MPGRLRTASRPSRIVIDRAPYSLARSSSGQPRSEGSPWGRMRAVQSPPQVFVYSLPSVHRQDRFCGGVSTYLIAPCAEYSRYRVRPDAAALAKSVSWLSAVPGHARSAVGVARAPAGDVQRPFRHDGAVGPVIFSASPRRRRPPRRSWPAVAPAPSATGSPRPSIPPPRSARRRAARSARHGRRSARRPPSATDRTPCLRRPAVTSPVLGQVAGREPRVCGSRLSGPGPDQRRRCPASALRRGAGERRPRPTSLPWVRAAPRASSRVRRTRSIPFRCARCAGGAVVPCAPVSSSSQSFESPPRSGRDHRRSTIRSIRFDGHPSPRGCPRAPPRSPAPVPPTAATAASAWRREVSNSANTSSSSSTGSAAVGAQQLVGRQPQRQRHRPRFAVAGKAFRRLIAEHQLQVVAVRADQTHAALQLGATAARANACQQGRLEVRSTSVARRRSRPTLLR